MSFRLKTSLSIGLIELTLLLLLVWTSMDFLEHSTSEQLVKRAQTAAKLVSTAAKNAVIATDIASLEEVVKSTLVNPDVVYLRIVTPDQGVLAAAGDPALLNRPFEPDVSFGSVNDAVFDVFHNIDEAGTLFGRVEMGLATTSAELIRQTALTEVLGLAGLELALVAIAALVLGSYLTRQLRDLMAAAQRMADGDFRTHVKVRTEDEFGQVGLVVNSMMDKLRRAEEFRDAYERELEGLNDELEERVVQRTRSLEATQRQLMRSEKLASIGELAAGVAHEINNPMAYVGANLDEMSRSVDDLLRLIEHYESCDELIKASPNRHAELMQMRQEVDVDFLTSDLPELVRESVEGANRVKKIVSALREFSHGDTGTWEAFDVVQGLNSTVSIALSRDRDRIDVVREFDEVPTIHCIASQIQQVLMNLLVNAAQAIEGDGRITLRIFAVDQCVHIEIEDTGCGIEESHLSKVFDPFFTTKELGRGTGLGLSISHGIVQSHQGELLAESEVGTGTKFSVVLPVHPEQDAAEAA